MLNFFKFIFWSAIALGLLTMSFAVWHNLETRAVRHHAASVAGNAQLAVDTAFEGVLAAQSGLPRNLQRVLLRGSPGNPFDRTAPAYVFGPIAPQCGEVSVSQVILRGKTPGVRVWVSRNCPAVKRHYLEAALRAGGVLQVWGRPGLWISADSWSPRRRTPNSVVRAVESPFSWSVIWRHFQNLL